MPNPLTGDFEGVLQVSGSTVNRLLASMHQNASATPDLPSFPHSVRMRIGDDHAFEGVRGVVHAQVSVPRIELLHGVTDRFRLEIGVRAWYRPDPGTTPMSTFIHGTVHAEYRVREIPTTCLGWTHTAANFLWVRVVRDSVRFQGTAEDDTDIADIVAAVSGPDPAARVAQITRQVARLLARRFQAAPHRVSKRFRRGAMRSLNAPIGGAAVAVPLGLSGEPWGQIASVDNVILGGRDVAVGVSIDYVMTLVAPALDTIKNFSKTVPVPDLDTVYHVGVHPPSVKWLPYGSHAVFEISFSGWAHTNAIWADATFTIKQNVTLYFDGGLKLSAWSPGVTVHASGVGSGRAADETKKAVLKEIPPLVQKACNDAQATLDKMSEQTDELATQLKTLDDQASVWLDEAEFLVDGIVLRGVIGLAPRRGMVVTQEKTAAGDAHSALESWIPGGRIDRLEWSWTWFGGGDPGQATFSDRFLLRRPWQHASRWGLAVGLRMALPGLDGWGRVCLRITGVRIDPVTGQLVTVTSTRPCTRFGYDIRQRLRTDGRLFLREMPELSQEVPFPQLAERPLVAVPRGRPAPGAANTLLIYVDRAWENEIADTLGGAVEACRRYDAGLGVLVLFREGLLEADSGRVIASIERHARKLGIAAHVNEDVHGEWARALDLRRGSGEPGWAIITPEGLAAWTHPGRVDARSLATALDTHLRRAPDLRPAPHYSAVRPGLIVGGIALDPGYGDLADLLEPDCPPLPLLAGLRLGTTIMAFVQKQGAASSAHLRRLAAQAAPNGGGPGAGHRGRDRRRGSSRGRLPPASARVGRAGDPGSEGPDHGPLRRRHVAHDRHAGPAWRRDRRAGRRDRARSGAVLSGRRGAVGEPDGGVAASAGSSVPDAIRFVRETVPLARASVPSTDRRALQARHCFGVSSVS